MLLPPNKLTDMMVSWGEDKYTKQKAESQRCGLAIDRPSVTRSCRVTACVVVAILVSPHVDHPPMNGA